MLDAVAWRRPAGEPEGDYILKAHLGCVQVRSWPPWRIAPSRGKEEEGAGSDSVNDNDDNEAAAAHEQAARGTSPALL